MQTLESKFMPQFWAMYEYIGVKFVNTIKVLPDVTCYLTTFVQKSQKSLHIRLLTR